MSFPTPLTLQNAYCILEPLSLQHCEDLIEAAKDGELWNLHYARVPTPSEMATEIERRLEAQRHGTMMPFTVIHPKTRKPIGMTTYCRIEMNNKQIEIGWTWYAKSFQRTSLNTACKQLLLTHAFEQLDCIAVRFRIDILNLPSRKAVERLGARLEGIIRNHSILRNGQVQDMCLYSILPHEWMQIKIHLNWLLQRDYRADSEMI